MPLELGRASTHRIYSTFLLELVYLSNSYASKNHALSPRASVANILAQTVACHAVPFDLLSCHRQLSSQTLECTLAKAHETLVQLLLVPLLRCRDFSNDTGAVGRGDSTGDRLVGQETNVSVLVVVHVNLERALEGPG